MNEEGASAALEILRDRIISFHLADNDGHKDQHSQPPYGTIDWETLVRAVDEMDFAYPATVEAPPWNRATPGTLLREVQALFAGEWPTFRLGAKEAKAICHRCGHYLFGPSRAPFCACERQ